MAFSASEPVSLRAKKVIRPIVNTPNPTHCVTERVFKSADVVKLLANILLGMNIMTNPNSNGTKAAIMRKILCVIYSVLFINLMSAVSLHCTQRSGLASGGAFYNSQPGTNAN